MYFFSKLTNNKNSTHPSCPPSHILGMKVIGIPTLTSPQMRNKIENNDDDDDDNNKIQIEKQINQINNIITN